MKERTKTECSMCYSLGDEKEFLLICQKASFVVDEVSGAIVSEVYLDEVFSQKESKGKKTKF